MASHGLRLVAGTSVLALMLTTLPGVASAADTALILGGSGLPDPPQSYVDAVEHLYLAPKGYGAYTPQVVITPEQLYPVTGVDSLPVDTSVAQGVAILDNAIKAQLAAGNRVVVFGYSQGAGVASQEMAQLASSPNPPSPPGELRPGRQSQLPQRWRQPTPRGTRRSLALPSLGATFNYAPTASNTYPTAVYTQEYDGFADFPQYPLDVLSDLNAYLGVFTQHFGYVDLTPQQISSAIALPTTGNTTTSTT